MANNFLKIMGNSPINRTMGFFINNNLTSWSMLDICEKAKVGYSTLKLILPHLIKYKLIFVERKIGKIKLYRVLGSGIIHSSLCDLIHSCNRYNGRN
jgi:hypothetical protein